MLETNGQGVFHEGDDMIIFISTDDGDLWVTWILHVLTASAALTLETLLGQIWDGHKAPSITFAMDALKGIEGEGLRTLGKVCRGAISQGSAIRFAEPVPDLLNTYLKHQATFPYEVVFVDDTDEY